MAIQIYEAYLGQDMEADGTRYLEAALKTEAKTADDYCERGKVYYYMDDYENARTELTTAADKGSTEATLILGMVYMAQEILPMPVAFISSILMRMEMIRRRAIMVWHSAISQMEIMTVHFRISARVSEMRHRMR